MEEGQRPVRTAVSEASSTRKARPRSFLYPYVGEAAAGIAGLAVERFGSSAMRRRYQTARLRALLHHAYDNVPFYTRRFDQAGFHPDQFGTLDDLRRVPIVRKEDIRLLADEEAVAKDYDPALLRRFVTGGSTGEPTRLRFSPFEVRLLMVYRLLINMRYGQRLTDRRTQLRSDVSLSKIDDKFILPSQLMYAFQTPEQMRTNLCQFQPRVIRGFPSVLTSFAQHITDEDRLQLRPRFLTTDSENLTELAREQIERGFGAPVYDFYDTYECNVIAYQCPHGEGYHILDSSIALEVLDEEGRPVAPGESGQVALTSMHSWAAPLIRYMPGDVVERGPSQCACGAQNSTLSKVFGRTHDRFPLPNGRTLFPKYLASALRPVMPSLRLYQIVQESMDRVAVKLQTVPGVEIPPEKLEAVRAKMMSHLGDGVTVLISVVNEIPCEPNGKFRPYKSYVKQAGGL